MKLLYMELVFLYDILEVKKLLLDNYTPINRQEQENISQYYGLWCEIIPSQYGYIKFYRCMKKIIKN